METTMTLPKHLRQPPKALKIPPVIPIVEDIKKGEVMPIGDEFLPFSEELKASLLEAVEAGNYQVIVTRKIGNQLTTVVTKTNNWKDTDTTLVLNEQMINSKKGSWR